MSTITKEQLQQIEAAAKEVLWPVVWSEKKAREHFRKKITPEVILELARIALASLEAEPVAMRWRYLPDGIHGMGEWNYRDQGYIDTLNAYHLSRQKELLYTAPPATVSVPDDVSGPLAHAYKELTPTFMRNHIDLFERYGIYPDGSAGIQAMRIALDGMNRRAAMHQGAEPVTTAYKLPDDFDLDRFNDVVWLEAVASNPHMHSLTTSTIAMVALELNRKLADRNSTVIQDGWVMVPVEPTAEMLQSGISAHYERSQIQIHDRPAPGPMECAYVAMLAAAPQQEAK